MKKLLVLLLVVLTLVSVTACANTVTLHCDAAGCENTVAANDNMDESWIVYCGPCSETLDVD